MPLRIFTVILVFTQKNTENVNQELKVMVEKGYRAVRILDNTVSKLKKEKIRDHFKIK